LRAPLGFNPQNVVTADIPLNGKRSPTLNQRWAVLRNVLDHVKAVPGVESASAVSPLPLTGQQTRRVGRADRPDAPPILVTQQFALPGYFHAIGTPLLTGRNFSEEDIATQRGATIIDQELAQRLWPEGAVGKRLVVFRTGHRDELEVIGVASAARLTRVRDGNTPHFVLPYGMYPGNMSLVIRTHHSAEALAPKIQDAVNTARPGETRVDTGLMSSLVSQSIGDTRFLVAVLSAFASAGILLAAIGLYGTLTYLTLQRTREFGIRLAVGSSVRGIIGIVLGESAVLALIGTMLGLLAAGAAAGMLREMLYAVRPLDAVTFTGTGLLVGAIALMSATVPAWRAAKTDPQISLRSE
jgi:putative ABC transport system permease protein